MSCPCGLIDARKLCNRSAISLYRTSAIMAGPGFYPILIRSSPKIAPMVQDAEIEKIAVQAVIAHEEARGWKVQSVEQENRGFDLISRRLHPEDPQTAIEVRFIEVKGQGRCGRDSPEC